MKGNPLRKLCLAYLSITTFAYFIILFLFTILSSLPATLNIMVTLFCLVPTVIMLVLVAINNRAYLYIKSKLHYIFIIQITLIATFANGLESTTLLFFFAIPFIAHSLEEDIIVPSIIIVVVFSFFVFCHYSPFLSEALEKINSLPSNIRFSNLNAGYIVLYYLLISVPFIQSFYYIRTQSSHSRAIDEKNRELNREKQFKENMLISAAHEIKTPHTIIKNSLNELALSYPDLNKSPLFPAINRELERVIKDASDIFDEAKLSISERLYNHDKVFCLSCFLREKALLFSSYAASKEITINWKGIESNLHIMAADEAIDKVINNLLDNAIKYTPWGGNIEIIAKSKEQKIELLIKDNGIGISGEDLTSVFIRYYQVTREKEVSRGIGLGLFLVKQILDTLEAEIEIDSAEKAGTTVQVTLDRYFVKANENLDRYSVSRPSFCPDMFKEVEDSDYDDSLQTVMIVEDEPSIAKIVKKSLQEHYNIITASNGKTALARLRKRKINLIISDVMMPMISGIDLCKEVKSRDEYKNIPFIFITAKTGDTERIKGLEVGAIDYISKPFNSTEVYLRVKNNLRLHELLIENSQSEIIDELENNYKEKIAQLPPRLKQVTDLLYYRPYITNREIADTLDLKLGSVGSYIKDIARKLNLKNERKSEVINFLRKYRDC